MASVAIGLGANLGDRLSQIQRAAQLATHSLAVDGCKISSVYESQPLGHLDQPNYYNAVMMLQTQCSPLLVLDLLQKIESDLGRKKNDVRWSPRVIDCDVLLWDEQRIISPQLRIPHPGLLQRAFVLYPLREIAPKWRLPDGKTISALCDQYRGPDCWPVASVLMNVNSGRTV